MTSRMRAATVIASAVLLGGVMGEQARGAEPPQRDVPVVNGDFEDGMDNWEGAGEISTAERHAGERSLCLRKGHVYQPPGNKQLIWVEPGRSYKISVWIKCDGCAPDEVTVMAGALAGPNRGDVKASGWLQGIAPKYVHDNGHSPAVIATGGTHDWKKFEAVIPAYQLPEDVRALFPYLRHDARPDPAGAAYFDDVSVARVPGYAEHSGPVVVNGGFEAGPRPWGGAFRGEAAEVVSLDPAERKACLKIGAGYVFQQATIEGGRRYRFSMKIRCEQAPEWSAFVQFSYEGTGLKGWKGPVRVQYPRRTEPALFVTGGTHGWKPFEAVIETPAAARKVTLYLRKMDGDGAAYYDDVAAAETDLPATTPQELRKAGMAPPTPTIDDEDFATPEIRNGGFEDGLAAWHPAPADSLFEFARSGTPRGKACLKLLSGGLLQGKILKPRTNYRISVRIRTQGVAEDNACVRLDYRRGSRRVRKGADLPFRDRRYRPVAVVTGGTHDWKEFSVVVRPPKRADTVHVSLSKGVDDGVAFFDDFTMTETRGPAVAQGAPERERLPRLLPPAETPPDSEAVFRSLLDAAKRTAGRGPLVLADAGETAYRIHVGSAKDPIEFHAAEELARYLQEITGAEFTPFSQDANPIDAPLLVVGRWNALTDRLCPGIPYERLGDDGFVLRTAGRNLVIAGAAPRGTLYGVYHFLDHELGVRWFSPEYTFVPRARRPVVRGLEEVQVPRFTYREIFAADGDDPRYCAHNRLNGKSHHREVRGCAPGIDSWAKWWGPGGHNLHRLVPDRKYHAGGQLAMMSGDVRRIAAESVVRILEKMPDYREVYYKISQQDRGWRPDPSSRRFAEAHGGALSAPIMDMVLDIAGRVRRKLPDAKLCISAYQWSRKPPQGMKKLPDHILAQVCSIECDFSQPLDGPKNRSFVEDLEGWCKLADKIVIWDYITNFGSYIQPHPNYRAVCETIKWLAAHPQVRGYFGQSSYGSVGCEFAELRTWVAARLLWNPDQDPQALIGEFVAGYYGEAARYVGEYVRMIEEAVRATDSKLTIRSLVTEPYMSFGVMRRADRLFERAERAVTGRGGFLRRVQTARIGVDYVILLRRADYVREAERAGMAWDPKAPERLARFKRYVAQAGLRSYGENVGSLEALYQAMKIERKVPPVPEICRGLPASNWVDYQDLSLRRYAGAEITEDRLASDNGALTMPGNKPDWGIQMKLDNLPPEGKWKLYAVVRVDPGRGPDSAAALIFGVHPGANRKVTLGEVRDGQYHTFGLPGAYDSNAGQGLFFAPPNSGAIRRMYVDRVIAVWAGGAAPARRRGAGVPQGRSRRIAGRKPGGPPEPVILPDGTEVVIVGGVAFRRRQFRGHLALLPAARHSSASLPTRFQSSTHRSGVKRNQSPPAEARGAVQEEA